MRVVVGTGRSGDSKEAEIDRHLGMMTRFAARAMSGSDAAPTITMILRSAGSLPAQALWQARDDLARAGVSAKVVLAKIEPDAELKQLYACLCQLRPLRPARELLRWAHNPRLLDAHEQVTLGSSMCWSGDAMRRDADKRNALALFDENAPDTAQLGRLSFESLWLASIDVPQRRLSAPSAVVKPSAAFEAEAALAASPLQPSAQGWPLVRH